MEIRSYRAVFELERRIYRIDRLRLNPGGVPVRGVVYFLALLGVSLLVGRLPLIDALPWYLLDLALPCAGAGLLGMVRVDGRPFHVAAGSLLRHQLALDNGRGLRAAKIQRGSLAHSGGRRHGGGHRSRRGHRRRGEGWQPPPMLLLPDGSDGRLRRMRYTGPGAVLVAVAHELENRSTRLPWRIVPRFTNGFFGRPLLQLREVNERESSDAHRDELPSRSGEQDGTVIVLATGVRIEACDG
jgi:hypothetical protein